MANRGRAGQRSKFPLPAVAGIPQAASSVPLQAPRAFAPPPPDQVRPLAFVIAPYTSDPCPMCHLYLPQDTQAVRAQSALLSSTPLFSPG